MRHVVAEAGQARTVLEAGEDQLVDDDRGKAAERDLKRLVMEQRDPEQRQREQDEVDGYSKELHILIRHQRLPPSNQSRGRVVTYAVARAPDRFNAFARRKAGLDTVFACSASTSLMAVT